MKINSHSPYFYILTSMERINICKARKNAKIVSLV